MDERAFVIQQIGAKDSPERRRADEIYEDIIIPAVREAGLEAYRADRDLTPGAITPKMLEGLLTARLVIADLTGRNPNVFYELGITHSFAQPLISIADSSDSLPFDAKDERVIQLGEYPPSGLGHRQVKSAIKSLRDSLGIVLGNDYSPPSPLRDVATIRSIDQLAPEDPRAAELAQMREMLEEIRKNVTPRPYIPQSLREDIAALRSVIEDNFRDLDPWNIDKLSEGKVSDNQRKWAQELRAKLASSKPAKTPDDDPWATAETSKYSDEPPF